MIPSSSPRRELGLTNNMQGGTCMYQTPLFVVVGSFSSPKFLPPPPRPSASRHRDSMMETLPTTQYQHFVPQFLLRNFSHPYEPAGSGKRRKRKDKNGLYPGENVVHTLDFTADPPVICEKAVKRILGQMNMYEDAAAIRTNPQTSNQEQRVEEMLPKLEMQASKVFRKITKVYEDV